MKKLTKKHDKLIIGKVSVILIFKNNDFFSLKCLKIFYFIYVFN